MSDNSISNKDVLHQQIIQLRELIATKENVQKQSVSIQPEEILTSLIQNLDQNDPVHPRLMSLVHGPTDVKEIKKALKRLENDLQDLKNINDNQSLYDPHKHKLEGMNESGRDMETNQDVNKSVSGKKPQNIREDKQRPLSAYQEPDE